METISQNYRSNQMFCHICGVSEARDVVTDSPGEGIFFWGGGCYYQKKKFHYEVLNVQVQNMRKRILADSHTVFD